MTEQPQEAVQEEVQLQISDLQALLQVVDVLSSRGAVKPEEMATVGAVRDKLATFLSHVAQASKENAESEEAEAEAAE